MAYAGWSRRSSPGVGIGDGRSKSVAVSAGPRHRLSVAMLLMALLGGLILNVMPCVLPVLSLKLLGLIGHDGENQRHVRLGFLASAAGILVAFAGLAAVLVALKGMGSAVGWGIQFQQPWFLDRDDAVADAVRGQPLGLVRDSAARDRRPSRRRRQPHDLGRPVRHRRLRDPAGDALFGALRRHRRRRSRWRAGRSRSSPSSSPSASASPRPICWSRRCRPSRSCCRGPAAG